MDDSPKPSYISSSGRLAAWRTRTRYAAHTHSVTHTHTHMLTIGVLEDIEGLGGAHGGGAGTDVRLLYDCGCACCVAVHSACDRCAFIDCDYTCDGGWGEGVVWVEVRHLDLKESGRGACCSGPAFYRES